MSIINKYIVQDDEINIEDRKCKKYIKLFLKWAGGKSQLVKEIEQYYPFNENSITKYVEPFVGGGAVVFDIINKFNLNDIYISDLNAELINTYMVIKECVEELINFLNKFQNEYVNIEMNKRKIYYLVRRERFNELKFKCDKKNNIEKAALMIFLNKTCFNGLFRVNKKGFFNVPMGSYKNPFICDEQNLRAVLEKLQNVKIVCCDYRESREFIDNKTFVYFDPPYRPLNKTSSFTSYTENLFNESEQIELAQFVDYIDKKGAKILISNSELKILILKMIFLIIFMRNIKLKELKLLV